MLLSFQDAIEKSADFNKRHLLLGNGFSIALKPDIFSYGSLLENADFKGNANLPKVFDALKTSDFEHAINSLYYSAALTKIYVGDLAAADKMKEDANALKEVLIETITRNHPNGPFDVDEDEFFSCRQFLSNFIGPEVSGNVFTLNYDLLLYWTLMHREFSDGRSVELFTNDGFGDDDINQRNEFVTWQGEGSRRQANVFFMHGALHLFDAGKELQKFTWIRKDERLKNQSWHAIQAGKLPLFVAEGESSKKATKIQHNAYLFQCLKKFRAQVDTRKTSLFIHGHSLAANDHHILNEIARGRCKYLFVGLHGDPESENNKNIKSRANQLSVARRPQNDLEVFFYDATSAAVWG